MTDAELVRYRRLYLFLGEPVALSGQKLLKAEKVEQENDSISSAEHPKNVYLGFLRRKKAKESSAHNSFLMLPVPSGSRTLKALRITSSGSAPGEEKSSNSAGVT